MNERHFRRLFPNASESTVKANCEVLPAKSREQTPALVGTPQGTPQGASRAHVRFVCARKRLLDYDNNVASIKDLLDGLVICGLIEDDSEKHIELQVTQRKTQPNEEPHTLIEIFYP